MTPNKPPTDNLVFIGGLFRSGTSLLSSLLNQNPALALMYECDVWNFPKSLLSYRFKRRWVERMEFFNQALSRHRIISEHNPDGLKKILTPADLYRAFGALKGATVVGEKSPFYCSRLEQLHQQYPDAAFILVWRDPVEVYRSVLKAGQTSRFFGKPGMLSRMIYHQEQAIRQADRIEQKGARLFRVNYADIVDHTEKVCRDISAFLQVPYDPQMLKLNQADLTAIYTSPHHAYLRRGIVERQKYAQDLVPPRIVRKLARYRHRWEQQQARWLNLPAPAQLQPGPGFIEVFYNNALGRGLIFYDSLVRAGFEFMPAPWLLVYRLFKSWVIDSPSGVRDEKTSLLKDLQFHWQSILFATVLLSLVALLHFCSNPHLNFFLFYAIPCALVALVVNNRWATLFVLLASIMAPLIQYNHDSDYHSIGMFAWNATTRFLMLEIIILTLGRIRQELSKYDHKVD